MKHVKKITATLAAAAGAKRAGDRYIRRSMRCAGRDWRRRQKARAATGYETEVRA